VENGIERHFSHSSLLQILSIRGYPKQSLGISSGKHPANRSPSYIQVAILINLLILLWLEENNLPNHCSSGTNAYSQVYSKHFSRPKTSLQKRPLLLSSAVSTPFPVNNNREKYSPVENTSPLKEIIPKNFLPTKIFP